MGSETSGGSVYTLDLVEPLNLGPGILNTWSGLEEIASFRGTIWTSEYDYNRHRAVIGKLHIALLTLSHTHIHRHMHAQMHVLMPNNVKFRYSHMTFCEEFVLNP